MPPTTVSNVLPSLSRGVSLYRATCLLRGDCRGCPGRYPVVAAVNRSGKCSMERSEGV
jgi:hypothetical protein